MVGRAGRGVIIIITIRNSTREEHQHHHDDDDDDDDQNHGVCSRNVRIENHHRSREMSEVRIGVSNDDASHVVNMKDNASSPKEQQVQGHLLRLLLPFLSVRLFFCFFARSIVTNDDTHTQILAISTVIVVLCATYRDSIGEALKAIDPSESLWRSAVYFSGGLVVVWGLVFTPITMYVLSMGYFYGYYAFAMLYIFLFLGLIFEFYAGRFLAHRFLGIERIKRWFPRESKYFVSFSEGFNRKPIWLTFLVVSAPIPLGFNLMLIGLFTDVSFIHYAIGSILSLSLTMPFTLMIGIQAENLDDALNPSNSVLNFVLTVIGIVAGVLIAVVVPRVMYRQLMKLKKMKEHEKRSAVLPEENKN